MLMAQVAEKQDDAMQKQKMKGPMYNFQTKISNVLVYLHDPKCFKECSNPEK